LEAEFETGAASVIALLHERGFAGDGELHGYHCDCPTCYDRNIPFRGQTDSTCSGEIISSVFSYDGATYDNGYDNISARRPDGIFDALQAAAVDADAEPGMHAGVHVHVGASHMDIEHRQDALWAFARVEPMLMHLAHGRFTSHRTMNHSVRDLLYDSLRRPARRRDPGVSTTGSAIAALENDDGHDDEGYNLLAAKQLATMTIDAADRHANLSTRTRHRTWEFRLWNSTRSAWRYEMFARVSTALVDPDVVGRLLEVPVVHRASDGHLHKFVGVLTAAGHDRAAELVQRQREYLRRNADSIPSILTLN
jgi:hypothetical protein